MASVHLSAKDTRALSADAVHYHNVCIGLRDDDTSVRGRLTLTLTLTLTLDRGRPAVRAMGARSPLRPDVRHVGAQRELFRDGALARRACALSVRQARAHRARTVR